MRVLRPRLGTGFSPFLQCMMLLLYPCDCTLFLRGARGDAPGYRRSFFAGSLHMYWCYTSSSFNPNCVVDDVNFQPYGKPSAAVFVVHTERFSRHGVKPYKSRKQDF